jgi:glycine cleavage system aminomethyltransferase T
MSTEHNPFEAGVSSAVDTSKDDDFVGKAALKKLRNMPARRLRCLVVDDGSSMILGKEPVFYEDKPVGYITTAAFGFTIGAPIAYAWVPSNVGAGAKVEVEYFGRRIRATIVRDPLYDPQNSRLLDDKPAIGDVQTPVRARL